MRTWSVLLLAALVTPVMAGDIYRTYDEDGNPVYTDQPPYEGAEPIEPGRITVTPGLAEDEPARERSGEREPAADEPEPGYAGIETVFPPREEAIRRITGEVEIRARLSGREGLREGDRMRVLIDGDEAGSGAGLEITVGPLDPGPRQVQVEVVDRAGTVQAASEPYRFYLIRQTTSGN